MGQSKWLDLNLTGMVTMLAVLAFSTNAMAAKQVDLPKQKQIQSVSLDKKLLAQNDGEGAPPPPPPLPDFPDFPDLPELPPEPKKVDSSTSASSSSSSSSAPAPTKPKDDAFDDFDFDFEIKDLKLFASKSSAGKSVIVQGKK